MMSRAQEKTRMDERSGQPADLENLLGDALQPIDPPEDLAGRVESMLGGVAEAAAAELSEWADEFSDGELRALRDPRNWFRPAAAVTAGGVAGTALVVIELRRRRGRGGVRGVAEHVRSLLP